MMPRFAIFCQSGLLLSTSAHAGRTSMRGPITDAEFSLASVGYGETRLVANNETEQGRKRNRRIDVVIRPSWVSGNTLASAADITHLDATDGIC
jgi:hypothetical protein